MRLTPKQEIALKKLRNKIIKQGIVSGLFFCLQLFLGFALVAFADIFLVQNRTFVIVMCVFTYLVAFSLLTKRLNKDKELIRQKVSDILKDNN